ncbi:hypothetical protein C823_004003 [Eubacterium plexicaudatum ASF492]|uniref:Uncharacterized protein n=1 Tax=Eubacterium plexicaudatum ASF492 TaxID=1235802 RepID=N2AB71_9FIRM|nr:hypothetical protein C823_004003 [Eubacterium plexicaudatum ASF492]
MGLEDFKDWLFGKIKHIPVEYGWWQYICDRVPGVIMGGYG